MKRVLAVIVMSLLIMAAAGMAFAGGKIVGKVKSLIIMVDDEKTGKVQKVDCGKNCLVKKRTNLKPGTKVTIEAKGKRLVVRKAVAGC
jgi:hypothetical protein